MKLLAHHRMPPVAVLMTPFPHAVGPDDPVARALELMREHAIRHVPVREGGHVVGIVSDRDLQSLSKHRSDTGSVRVRDVQTLDPFTTELTTPLSALLGAMAERRLDAAIITRAGRLAGIVTSTDVCQALADVLDDRFGTDSGGDVA